MFTVSSMNIVSRLWRKQYGSANTSIRLIKFDKKCDMNYQMVDTGRQRCFFANFLKQKFCRDVETK